LKEATGELNMTVVTIVAIGAIVAFFYLLIWPTIQTNMALTTACNAAGYSDYQTSGTNSGKTYSISCSAGVCTYTEGTNTSTRTCAS